jgi:hypothetical protein
MKSTDLGQQAGSRWVGRRDFRFQISDFRFEIRDSRFEIRDSRFFAELGNDFTYSVPLTAYFRQEDYTFALSPIR